MEKPEGAGPPRAGIHGSVSPIPGDGGGELSMRPAGDLVDSTLLEEIMLLSEVITAVAGRLGHLDGDEIDEVLGVRHGGVPGSAKSSRPRSRRV